MEAPPRFELGIRVLQTLALPLGYSAKNEWSGLRGSNSLPPPWQGGALPDELNPHLLWEYGRLTAFGASGRNRTNDTGIFSPLLFQLSYRGGKPITDRYRPEQQLAIRTRLELVTSAVTGRRSNQLNYRTELRSLRDRPPIFQASVCKEQQRDGGSYRARTYDPLLVRQMLSQLS